MAQTARLESSTCRGPEGCFGREGQGNPHLSQNAQETSETQVGMDWKSHQRTGRVGATIRMEMVV